MRRPTYQYYHNTATSFYTPQSTRKSSLRKPDFSMTQRQFNTINNKQAQKLDISLPLRGEENPQIYFDKSKRKTFIKGLIDGYFKPPSSMLQFYDPADAAALRKSSIRRKNVYSSDCVKRNAEREDELKEKVRTKILEFNISSLKDFDKLPTINEGQFAHRPTSEYHPTRKLQQRPTSPFSPLIASVNSNISNLQDSIIYDDKSILGSKVELRQKEKDDCKASKQMQQRLAMKKNRIFQTLDDDKLIRQKLIKKIGLPVMWKQTPKQTVLEYVYVRKTLKEMCYSILQDKKGEEPLFLIFPTDYYHSLFVNNCEQLTDIVKALCKIVVSGKNQISNNAIHMNNVHKVEEKNFQLYDWGCAAVRETLVIQGLRFPKTYEPNARKDEQWLLQPEYLAPELLRAIEYGSYQHLWAQKGGIGSCDVWSIGCLLFQLITLIPINQPNHCVIKGQQYSRRGLMGTKIRTVQNIIAKQKHFRSLVVRRIKDLLREKQAPSINMKLLHLLPKILQQNPAKRISATQILSILN